MVNIYWQRSLNEISIAKLLLTISDNEEKKQKFQIDEDMTFYSGAISHAYYSIFYSNWFLRPNALAFPVLTGGYRIAL